MNKLNWKETAELLAMAAIVASLLFVGLQLKQAQDIAISTQYHQRTALAVEVFNAQLESGDLAFWGKATGREPTEELPYEELGQRWLTGAVYLALADNHYYQYQSGFLEEESWQAQRRTLKLNLATPESAIHYALRSRNGAYRASFLELCDELTAEAASEARE
jgi:hypothetical protein